MQSYQNLKNPQNVKIQDLIKRLKSHGNVDKFFMEECLKKCTVILSINFVMKEQQPNVLSINSPTVVVGDIHGQFYDLQNIIQRFSLKNHSFLFLGDYVDRGHFCVEVITLLMVLKIQRPNTVHLLRGNHESRTMTSEYNFKQECKNWIKLGCKKYSTQMYQKIMDFFKLLPLAAVVDGQYFCVHGGISPEFKSISELQRIKRTVEIPDSGIMCDLMWSDPIDDDDIIWQQNSIRGVSYFFSRRNAQKFLKQNNFRMIIRAHELQDEGFRFQEGLKGKKDSETEQYSLTLFSAPNYCDKFSNKGAIAIIRNDRIRIQTFQQVEHPVVLPGYMDVFEWSMPFMSICVEHLFRHLTKERDNRRKTSIQPIKEILSEVKEYENLQNAREIFKKIIEVKNESFPVGMEENAEDNEGNYNNEEPLNQIANEIQAPPKTCAEENVRIPGPFSTRLSKIEKKLI